MIEPRLRSTSSIVIFATWCRMADSTTSLRFTAIVCTAWFTSVKSKFWLVFSGSLIFQIAKPLTSTPWFSAVIWSAAKARPWVLDGMR